MKIIIVPTDFSENAANAVKYAIQMSKMHYNKLIFMHVYSLPFLNPEAGMVYDQSYFDAMNLQVRQGLNAHIEKVYESMGMHRNLLLSELEVTEAISLSGGIEKLKNKYQANMIIMGTHGATGLKKFFLGSNAVDVLENTNIPLLTIPNQNKFNEIKNIAYASDFTNIDEELKEVVNFAKSYNAKIDVIHIANDNSLLTKHENDPILNNWKKVNNYQNINLHIMQAADNTNASESLKVLLNEINFDVLAMFHKQRNFWKSLFEKSTTSDLVYEWTAPILTMYKK
jgi:nucleotide-binding universal stress UspA family protein